MNALGLPRVVLPKSRHVCALIVLTVLAIIALPNVTTHRAQAMDIGMTSGDNSWQEEYGWEAIQHSGATVFRMQMSRASYLEHGWSQFDFAFRSAAERGIVILPYLYGYKDPKQFPTESEWGPPGNPWETWLYEVVHRYGYGGDFWTEAGHPVQYHPVGAWELWNEPNLPENNPGGAKAQPENYARFLNRSSQAIRSAQAEKSSTPTQIVFGGLYSQGGMPVGEFLQKANNVGGTGASFDDFALHPYAFQGGLTGVESNVNSARKSLTTYFGNKQLWITELGWNVAPWGDGAHPAVNEATQAQYLTESFNWLKSVASEKNIHLLDWYFFRDNPASEKWDSHAGLWRADGSVRPAWSAFQAQTGATEWPEANPYSWHSENLGGVNTSDADMASSGVNNLDVFGRGSDNHLWHTSWNGIKWTGWVGLGGSTVESGPGAVYQGGGQTDVMANLFNHEVSHWFTFGSGWLSQTLGGNNTSDPDLSSWGSGRLDLFVRGSDAALWHRYWNGVSWSGWESLGGSMYGGPGAVSWGPNRIDVVARSNDANHSLTHWWYDGSWHCCDNLGGINTSDPDLATTASGHLVVAVRGSDNALYLRQYDVGNGWGAWEQVPSSYGTTSGPSAISWGKHYRLDLVARREDNTLTHWWWGPAGP